MSELRVSLFEALAQYDPSFNQKKIIHGIIYLTVVLSFLFSALLIHISHGWRDEFFALFETKFATLFNTYCFDMFLLNAFQSILLPYIAWCAIRTGQQLEVPKQPLSSSSSSSAFLCDCFKCCAYKKSDSTLEKKHAKFSEDIDESRDRFSFEQLYTLRGEEEGQQNQPLLSLAHGGHSGDKTGNEDTSEQEKPGNEGTEGTGEDTSAGDEGYEQEDQRLHEDKKDIDEEYLQLKSNNTYHRNMYIGLLFTVSSLLQLYIGLKCISFNYTNEARQGALIGFEVLWVNVMTWSLKELIHSTTEEEGELVPSLHPHRLKLHSALAAHWCDLCGEQCKEGRAYRCKLCDFDLCVLCFHKRDSGNVEGQLRGDKGIRQEETLTSSGYFSRGLTLLRAETKLFSVGLLTLFLFNICSLAIPQIQGSTLNAVVNANEDHFYFWVKVYIVTAALSGVLGGIQGLCFQIVGRKVANAVRSKLFGGILLQDIAFFDGNSTGQLISRLTNDVSFMVSPLQTMLGTLLSNVLLLIGGFTMAFYTSWRLSILAFCTIGPIMHVTQVYAQWSQWLYRQIYAALAAANGHASEALGNIRTVKALRTESIEEVKYNEANDNALKQGIKDAYGSAGMYAINTYLELGASVMILWYGGKMVMDDKDGMTTGKLITYQLYWNMLNSAYKNLLDIVTSFTRGAGAAQKVFAVMDSIPDIDPDAGERIYTSEVKGLLTLQNVSFVYQMRPDRRVLHHISLNIPAGSTCALVGQSGGGKSTLVNLLMRFYDPVEGQIFLDGRPLASLCLRDVRSLYGVVQQQTEVFGGTIEENITYGMQPGSWTRGDVIAAARKACAHQFIKDFPEGYHTRVGERGVRISGGQLESFSANPNCFYSMRRPVHWVQAALDALMAETKDEKRTVILVAHRLSTVINADQIVVINQGQVIEVGKHEALLEKRGVYYRLIQKQLSRKNEVINADDDEDAEDEDELRI